MRDHARWVVAFAMALAVSGAAAVASAETPSFDSGTCFGAGSCRPGYVCVSGYCTFRGDPEPPACVYDSDCGGGTLVCVDRRCASRVGLDGGSGSPIPDIGGIAPPPDRPGSEDRIVDVVVARDVDTAPPPDRPIVDRPVVTDQPIVTPDVPPPMGDTGTVTDAGVEGDAAPTGSTGQLVQGCGCRAAGGASSSRAWWALGLLGLALRRRRATR